MDRKTRGLVLGCFFLSGATGLVYQGVWFRYLQALFGVTTHALAVVVAAFMGGLAAGSWLFGGIADRSPRPLRLYGRLEVGVGLLALLVGPCVGGIERLYVALHPALADSLVALSLLRLGLALAALLAPTLLMGGTLPALTVLLRRESRASGSGATLHRDLGWLYGLNTFGAVAGTALGGFVLLAHLGLLLTTLFAAAANVAIGLVCIRLGSRTADAVEPRVPVPDTAGAAADDRRAQDRPLIRFAALGFAVSGGLSLAYEVAWTRVLTQVIGSSTYAFSMILAAFLLGIALGSALLARWRGRDLAGLWGFCWAELAIGATAALVVPLLVRLPDLQLQAFGRVRSLDAVLAVQFALCLLVVLLPTLAMGATFPLVAGFVASHTADVGRAVGRLYAGNTVGGILGSMLAGFVALPHLGAQRTLLLVLCGNVALALAGLVLLARRERGGDASPATAVAGARRTRLAAAGSAVVAIALVAVAFLTPPWDPYVLDAGIAVGGPATARGDATLTARDVGRGSDILFYREGLNANISVRKDETQLYLKTNGKTDGTSRGDMPTQLMLGLLPSLVHPDPQRTLVIGLGTGASARAAGLPRTLQRLDVVEIEPAVVEAARRCFGEVNAGLFEDPRAHIWLDDARAFLLTTSDRYDLVVSEPSNPWIAGVASLFGVEHYRRAAARLAPGGIVAQWLQIYALRPELVRMVLASMHAVFPHLQVWSFHHGDLIVLASREPLPRCDLARIDSRLDAWGVRDEVRDVLGVGSAAGVVGFHLLDEADAAGFAAGAPLNTEDRPRLEFAAPRSLYLATRDSNAELLRAARRGLAPPLAPGQQLTGGDRLDLARAALQARRPADAAVWVREALADPSVPRAEALVVAGETALALRQPEAAEARLVEALRLDPASRRGAEQLALLRFLQGRAPDALRLLDGACAPDPQRTRQELEACAELLDLALQRNRADLVLPLAERLLASPGRAPADSTSQSRWLGLVARAELQLRNREEAERWARRALSLNAQSTASWRVLGELAFEARRYPEAIGWWERLVDFRQTGVDVLVPLAIACQRAGRRTEARRCVERALLQEPRNAAALRLRAELR